MLTRDVWQPKVTSKHYPGLGVNGRLTCKTGGMPWMVTSQTRPIVPREPWNLWKLHKVHKTESDHMDLGQSMPVLVCVLSCRVQRVHSQHVLQVIHCVSLCLWVCPCGQLDCGWVVYELLLTACWFFNWYSPLSWNATASPNIIEHRDFGLVQRGENGGQESKDLHEIMHKRWLVLSRNSSAVHPSNTLDQMEKAQHYWMILACATPMFTVILL